MIPCVCPWASLPSGNLLQRSGQVWLEPSIDVAHAPPVLPPQLQVAREQLVQHEAHVRQEAGAAPELGYERPHKLVKGSRVDALGHTALHDLWYWTYWHLPSHKRSSATHRCGLFVSVLRHVHDGGHGERGSPAPQVFAPPGKLADEY